MTDCVLIINGEVKEIWRKTTKARMPIEMHPDTMAKVIETDNDVANIGDLHDGLFFTPRPRPIEIPTVKDEVTVLREALLRKGVVTTKELDDERSR